FWREEVKQGRENRPRIDIFIRHFLTLAMRRDIRVGHIFNEYKNYVQYTADWGSCFIDPANSASEHMALLKTYAEHFRQFSSPAAGSRLAHFLARLVVIDTSTVYPLLLLCSQRLRPQQQTEFEAILTVLESYLFRRMICGLTTKNYNRLFLDLIRHLEREKQITAQVVGAFLLSSEGESVRFPKDGELSNALLDYPLYQWWPQYRVRAVLKALERALAHAKSEAVSLPTGLTIEHILPVKWQEHWPLPAEVQNDPQANVEFSQRRDRIKHTLGNLTLVTSSLNPALSNSAWAAKKPELLKWSKLNLSRDLHDHEEWSEQEILARGAALAKSAIQIWPYPDVDR
ncbi:TPA: HNH endonuclease family protein, partial [Pseudomonas aeruginosa]